MRARMRVANFGLCASVWIFICVVWQERMNSNEESESLNPYSATFQLARSSPDVLQLGWVTGERWEGSVVMQVQVWFVYLIEPSWNISERRKEKWQAFQKAMEDSHNHQQQTQTWKSVEDKSEEPQKCPLLLKQRVSKLINDRGNKTKCFFSNTPPPNSANGEFCSFIPVSQAVAHCDVCGTCKGTHKKVLVHHSLLPTVWENVHAPD